MASGNGSVVSSNGAAGKPLVFVSYSKHDLKWKDELLPHLIALQLDDQLEVWHDGRIDVGGKWRDEIEKALTRSAAAVCLVSKHFLATEFIVKEEVRYFLEQADARGLPILPLLLGHCPWQSIRWIKEIQMLPGKGRTITGDHNETSTRSSPSWPIECLRSSGIGASSCPNRRRLQGWSPRSTLAVCQ